MTLTQHITAPDWCPAVAPWVAPQPGGAVMPIRADKPHAVSPDASQEAAMAMAETPEQRRRRLTAARARRWRQRHAVITVTPCVTRSVTQRYAEGHRNAGGEGGVSLLGDPLPTEGTGNQELKPFASDTQDHISTSVTRNADRNATRHAVTLTDGDDQDPSAVVAQIVAAYPQGSKAHPSNRQVTKAVFTASQGMNRPSPVEVARHLLAKVQAWAVYQRAIGTTFGMVIGWREFLDRYPVIEPIPPEWTQAQPARRGGRGRTADELRQAGGAA